MAVAVPVRTRSTSRFDATTTGITDAATNPPMAMAQCR